MTNRSPRNIPIPPDREYLGKHDYQGNHDVFEMPEEQKPADGSMPKMPLNKIALGVIVLGVIFLLVLVCVSILQQTPLIKQ